MIRPFTIRPPDPGAVPTPAAQDLARFDLRFPLAVGQTGRVEGAAYDEHVRQMIEQVLFTSPGERVNRPDFGCGVQQLVFGPAGDAQAAATQFLVLGALQQWMGDVIQVEGVTVAGVDSTLSIAVQYVLRATTGRRTDTFPLGDGR
jgi:phage baseplate assembly protein W